MVKESGVIEALFEKYDHDNSGTIEHAGLMAMMLDVSRKDDSVDDKQSAGATFATDDLAPALFGASVIPEGVLKPETMKYTKTQVSCTRQVPPPFCAPFFLVLFLFPPFL